MLFVTLSTRAIAAHTNNPILHSFVPNKPLYFKWLLLLHYIRGKVAKWTFIYLFYRWFKICHILFMSNYLLSFSYSGASDTHRYLWRWRQLCICCHGHKETHGPARLKCWQFLWLGSHSASLLGLSEQHIWEKINKISKKLCQYKHKNIDYTVYLAEKLSFQFILVLCFKVPCISQTDSSIDTTTDNTGIWVLHICPVQYITPMNSRLMGQMKFGCLSS